jgi:predicted MFS family arabinose efflux permease
VRPWLILLAIGLARIGFGYQFQSIATLGPRLVPMFHLSYAALGSLIGAYSLFGVLVALPFGVLARWFGDRVILATGLALMVVGAVFDASASGPSGIAVGRSIAGIGTVATTVLQGKIIADFFLGRRLMLAIGVVSCTFPIGLGMTQLILPPLAGAVSIHAALLTEAVAPALGLLVFLASYRAPPSIAAPAGGSAWPTRDECVLLIIAGAVWTTFTSGYFAYTAYVPSTLAARGDGAATIGFVMLTATWGNVPATLIGAGLADRFGALRIVLIAHVALFIGMIGTALASGAPAWSLLVGVIGSIHPSVIMVVGTLSARQENRAVGMGMFYSIYYLGGAISPALCGYAADAFGGPAGGVLAGALISAATVPLFFWHRKLGSHEAMLVRA